jgi:transposase
MSGAGLAEVTEENARLKALLAQTQTALADSEEARRRLETILTDLRREKFGAKSEKLNPDQFSLALEDVELAQGVLDAAQEKAAATLAGKPPGAAPAPRRNRGRLPAHLPRVERVIEPASTLCPCGCGEMTKIGEDVSERLDVVPAQLRVLVTRRPRYACRRCSGAVVQAHAPEHVVPGGLPTEALIAEVIVAKFGDHLPFYRQAGIYARHGIRLDRATLGNWAGRACFHLQPIAGHMRNHLAGADRLFMDETTAPVLDPGRGQIRKGFFWAITSDDRGHGGPSPPVVLFRYAPGRGGVHAEGFLEGFRGRFLQCDGYDGYECLTGVDRPEGPWTVDAGALLEPPAAALRQADAQHQIPDRRGRRPADRHALRHRGERPRHAAGGAASRPAGAVGAHRRRDEDLVRDAAVDDLLGLHPGRGHPLWPRPLAGPQPLPRRRSPRDGHQPGRERH